MKKLLSVISSLCLVISLFSGCHGARERIAYVTPEAFDTSRNYEITFWAKNDTNLTQTNIYRKAIEDFQTIYPNIDSVWSLVLMCVVPLNLIKGIAVSILTMLLYKRVARPLFSK